MNQTAKKTLLKAYINLFTCTRQRDEGVCPSGSPFFEQHISSSLSTPAQQMGNQNVKKNKRCESKITRNTCRRTRNKNRTSTSNAHRYFDISVMSPSRQDKASRRAQRPVLLRPNGNEHFPLKKQQKERARDCSFTDAPGTTNKGKKKLPTSFIRHSRTPTQQRKTPPGPPYPPAAAVAASKARPQPPLLSS